MVSIAAIRLVMDLWEKGLKFWDSRRDRDSKLYDEVYGPLFSKLEPITQSYLDMLADARKSLIERPPALSLTEIAQNMINARNKLMIGRTSITGIANGYRRLMQGGVNFSSHRERPTTLDQAVEDFLSAIAWLFVDAASAEVAEEQFLSVYPYIKQPAASQGSAGAKRRRDRGREPHDHRRHHEPSPQPSPGIGIYSQASQGSKLLMLLEERLKLSESEDKEPYYSMAAERMAERISVVNDRWAAVATANHELKTMMKG